MDQMGQDGTGEKKLELRTSLKKKGSEESISVSRVTRNQTSNK